MLGAGHVGPQDCQALPTWDMPAGLARQLCNHFSMLAINDPEAKWEVLPFLEGSESLLMNEVELSLRVSVISLGEGGHGK